MAAARGPEFTDPEVQFFSSGVGAGLNSAIFTRVADLLRGDVSRVFSAFDWLPQSGQGERSQMRWGRAAFDHRLLAMAWLIAGVLLAALFAAGYLLPFRGAILLLAMLTVIGVASLRMAELSVLSRFFVILFSLPFSATAGYLVDLDFRWMCAPNIVAISRDHDIMSKMLTMAAVGLCGMMAGMEFMAIFGGRFKSAAPARRDTNSSRLPTLGWRWFGSLLAVSLLLSWLHAPNKTIFEAAYYSSTANPMQIVGTGLQASYLVSYLILILLYVDAEREHPGSQRRRRKFAAVAVVAAYIVVVFQFLRGDRECTGLLAGAALLYVTNPTAPAVPRGMRSFWSMDSQFRRMLTLALPTVACILAFVFLETFRHSASGTVFDNPLLAKSFVDRTRSNTWTAVARNNLGLAADYHYGTIEYLNGQTYVDYLLSLPPGAITALIGYQRPLDSSANPSQWYTCLTSIGGMHPVVVPFRNFGIWGVIPAMFICGAIISYCETRNRHAMFSDRLLYGFVATTSMLWYWYGDINIVRALMAWGILGAGYQLVTGAVSLQSWLTAIMPASSRPKPARGHRPIVVDWGHSPLIERLVHDRREFVENQIAISAGSFD